MKKKIIISIVACLFLIIGIIGFLIWNNVLISTITLDINPSIEIKLDRKGNVKSVIALNDDAKEIIDNKFEGKSLNELLYDIVSKVIDKGYIENDHVVILLHSKRYNQEEQVGVEIEKLFNERHIDVDVIVIQNITKDDEKLAKKYNISLAKASYINSILKENSNINEDDLVYKSVNDLDETKNTGNYCPDGYNLEGSMCFKEKERIAATKGEVCPRGYMDYNGICYEETVGVEGEESVCREEFELKDGSCIKTSSYRPIGNCSSGVLNNDEEICVEKEFVLIGEEYCRDPGRTLYEHKCLATKPSINGGCLNGDMYYNGKCVNTRDDYYVSEWKCPDGTYNMRDDGDESKCYQDKKTTRPTYDCDDGFVLENNMCVRTEINKPETEMLCPSGYTKVDFNRCINMNHTKNFETGFVCDIENARVVNDKCVIYEVIEANSN
ncbi:MAG: hypothetical protein IKN63_03255 [Bacilli bacterium]|nr:hypothetical protein [Bacilli bacterium]